MALHLDRVGTRTTAESVWSWTTRDSLLYAISVGAGDTGTDAELSLTTQNSAGVRQQVLPTFAVVMGMGHDEISMEEFGDFSLTQVLHAGQKIVQHAPIPSSGAARIDRGVSAIYDKGKNALIEITTSISDSTTGDQLVESIAQIIVRGEGGFGGDPGPREEWASPVREADAVVRHSTHQNQALLYRLNGDTNPLHSDPDFARRAGFDRPILHGLCTYGFAARALLSTAAGGDPSSFGQFSARFIAPVLPGEQLDTHIWLTEEGALFQTRVADRVVMDRGEFLRRT